MRKEKPFEKYWLIDGDIAVDVRPSDRVIVQFKSTGHKLIFDRDLITILSHNLKEEEMKLALDFVMISHMGQIQEKIRANGFKYYERLEKRRKNVLSDRTYEHIVWLQARLLFEYSRRKGKSLKEALEDFNANQLIEYIHAYHEILSYCAIDSILRELMDYMEMEKRGDESVWDHVFSWQY